MQDLIKIFEVKTSALLPSDTDMKGVGAKQGLWAESLGASERHRRLLEQCQSHLNAFLSLVTREPVDDIAASGEGEADVVIAAEELRHASDCLAKITGKGEAGGVEEVLGVIFEK